MTNYLLPEMTVAALPDRPLAVVLGNFDGVHLGHRRLLLEACALAAGIPDCIPAVWTFTSLAKNSVTPVLTEIPEKLRLIAEAGIRAAVLEEFDCVRGLSPETFVREYLVHTLRCAAVVCGEDFRFGKGRAGDVSLLGDLLAKEGILLSVVPSVMMGGEPISSTRIRLAVKSGDMEEASALLGRPFSVCLPVLHGNRIGHTIGLPTVNQTFPDGHIVPARGIYACICTVDGQRYEAAANVGTRPTVSDGDAVNCETHILDFDGDLYGQTVRVDFCFRLREERKFSSVAALKAAIEQDVRDTRAYFAKHPIPARKEEKL
ncbi:MAG: riboflavin biosynthesis protein RibF [Clostridia bacterium]|nr:riboflavin biosynthesis protein RibF [Clostridia bacterium]